LPPAQTLQDARTHLLQVFTRHFTEATKARDAIATTRFFKLFPVIGWETEGLEAYASFIVDLVKVRPPASAQSTFPQVLLSSVTITKPLQRLPHYTTSPL
jgi:conserved oligomeric Golgi complex subunit 4